VDLDRCPACKRESLGAFAWLASWPFSASCNACHARVRRRQHLWLGVLCQPIGFLAVVLSSIWGMSSHSSTWLAGLGVAAGFAVLLLPVLLGRFVVVAEQRLAS
jgi:hypothetical protein